MLAEVRGRCQMSCLMLSASGDKVSLSLELLWLGWLVSPENPVSASPELRLQLCSTVPDFYVCLMGPGQALMLGVGTLPIEPSQQPPRAVSF